MREKKKTKKRKKSEEKQRMKKNKKRERITRPDTRPPVADGWARAEMRVSTLFDSITTDQRTEGWTHKASYRVACPQLKKSYTSSHLNITSYALNKNLHVMKCTDRQR